jgi:beta-glucosidase
MLLPFGGAQILAQTRLPYQDPFLPTEKRVTDLLSRMTLEEKIDMLGGSGYETKPNARLGIPPLNMTDGPLGVRWGKATAFPASIAMAATWNPSLIQKLGVAIAQEAKAKGRHMLLAPCININRVPQGGRDFESFGEDPYLTSRMAVAYVKGVQSEKVVACAKHYVANNQEWERTTISANIDERTLREIYLPAFKAAVEEGGAWTVMSAYNKLNGEYCSENPWLLTEVLKGEWGFRGFVVSDWGAVHSTVPTANAGLDLEMPTGKHLNASLLDAVKDGQVKEQRIDDMISRILRVMFWAGALDEERKEDPSRIGTAEIRNTALAVAREGIVLLRNNDRTLPLDGKSIKSIAVIGPNAAVLRTGGGGSSQVEPISTITPLEAFRSKIGSAVRLIYAPGCFLEGDIVPIETTALHPSSLEQGTNGLRGEYFDNMECSGTPVLTRIDDQIDFTWAEESPGPGVPKDKFSVRWTGLLQPPASGTYELSVQTDDGVRLYLDEKLLIDNWGDHAVETRSATVALEEGKAYAIRVEYYENGGWAIARLGWHRDVDRLITEAVEAARSSDVAIVVAGLSANFESEGFDRQTLELPASQQQLIREVEAANRNTVVVLNVGAPILMGEWAAGLPAVVLAWYPGQEGGRAIADVLFGDVNPSGKLPVTFPKRWEHSPAFGNYPGSEGNVDYKEGLLVGYRYFDTKDINVEYPFGYGLSYSTFRYSNLRITAKGSRSAFKATVSLDLKNTSLIAGSEVVQLYVHAMRSSIPRPAKELKAFRKVQLKPGETTTISFELDPQAFSFFHPGKKKWVVERGRFKVLVASSSRHMRLTGNLDVR